jgi:hypothetical protein
MDVFVGFVGLFQTREGVRESLGPEVLYLFLCAFISFMLARNAILGIFIFIAPRCMLAVQCPRFRSVGSVSYLFGFL